MFKIRKIKLIQIKNTKISAQCRNNAAERLAIIRHTLTPRNPNLTVTLNKINTNKGRNVGQTTRKTKIHELKINFCRGESLHHFRVFLTLFFCFQKSVRHK